MVIFFFVCFFNIHTRKTLIKTFYTKSIEVNIDFYDESNEARIFECYDNRCHIKDIYGVFIRQVNFPSDIDRLILLGSFDIDGLPPLDLIFLARKGDSLFIEILAGDKIKEHKIIVGKDISKVSKGFDGWVYISSIVKSDINNDGYKDLIIGINSGFDLYPRGIFVFDIKNERELFHRWVSGCPVHIFVDDINNDGEKEILFGTFAPCNGAVVDGIDDFSSYLYILDNKGNIILSRRVGDYSTDVLLGIIEKNGLKKIVVCETEGLDETKEPNTLFILDPLKNEIEKYIYTGDKHFGLVVEDIDRDNRKEIITGNKDGIIRVFDEDLNLIKSRKFNTTIEVNGAEDLDCDGRIEVIAFGFDNRLIILDEDLKTICESKEVDKKIVNLLFLKKGKEKGVFINNYIYGTSIFFLKEELSLFNIVNITSYVFLMIIFFLAIYLIINFGIRIRRVRMILDSSPDGVVIINRFGKIVYKNKKIKGFDEEELRKILLLIKEEKKELEIEGKRLLITMINLKGEKIFTITDITDRYYSGSVLLWSGIAQRLAHEIKNPLSILSLTLQRIGEVCKCKDEKKIREYVESSFEEIERLKDVTDKFMKVLSIDKPIREEEDINEILETTLKTFNKTISKDLKIDRKYKDNLPKIYCDKYQLIIAFSNIIDNAIKSMKGKGKLSIETGYIEKIIDNKVKGFIEVMIQDTGIGMDKEELKELFRTFRTNREDGTGIGLIITKRIIDEHKGEIEFESKVGVGTIVRVILPTS